MRLISTEDVRHMTFNLRIKALLRCRIRCFNGPVWNPVSWWDFGEVNNFHRDQDRAAGIDDEHKLVVRFDWFLKQVSMWPNNVKKTWSMILAVFFQSLDCSFQFLSSLQAIPVTNREKFQSYQDESARLMMNGVGAVWKSWVTRFLFWKRFLVVLVPKSHRIFLDEFSLTKFDDLCRFLDPKTMWLPKDWNLWEGISLREAWKGFSVRFHSNCNLCRFAMPRWIVLLWWCMPEGFWRGAKNTRVLRYLCNFCILCVLFLLFLLVFMETARSNTAIRTGVTSSHALFEMCFFFAVGNMSWQILGHMYH